MNQVWSPLFLSLRIALVATVLTSFIAVPLAFFMSRARFAGRSVVDALITIPLVLPPTVVGYFIIVVFGAQGWIGQFLQHAFGISILFRFQGAVLAAMIVALPLLYIPSKSAFASIDRDFEELARLLGAGRLRMFWHVSLPLARRGIASGMVLAFARALGEFGATIMVFGWQPRRVTLPISIYSAYEQGELPQAGVAVFALSVVSLITVMVYNRWSSPERR